MTERQGSPDTADETLAARRRHAESAPLTLPAHLGITVRRGPVPESLDDAVRPSPWVHATPQRVLVRFTSEMGVLIEDGDTITVNWDPAADPTPDGDPSWLVQGWAVGIAMLQRGHVNFHAATVDIGGKVFGIAGDSGAGKSTTTMALRARGHRLLVDDLMLVEVRDGATWTTPFGRNVHLLPDAAARLGIDFDRLPMLAGARVKAAFRPEEPPAEPRRLHGIFVLEPDADTDHVVCTPVDGGMRFAKLSHHAQRGGLAPYVLGPAAYFTHVARVAATTPTFVITRPTGADTLDEVVTRIEHLAAAID